jgi:hypothetical protein
LAIFALLTLLALRTSRTFLGGLIGGLLGAFGCLFGAFGRLLGAFDVFAAKQRNRHES